MRKRPGQPPQSYLPPQDDPPAAPRPPKAPHQTERITRTQRDLQTITGRRSTRDEKAVLWGEIEDLISELATRSIRSQGQFIRALGGLPETDISRRITTIVNYVDAEVAGALVEANAALQAEIAAIDIDITDLRNETLSLLLDLGTRFDQEIPRISTAERQIDDFALELSRLASMIYDTDQRVAEAGIYVDPDNGRVLIRGFEQIENRVSNAEILVDAVAAEISTKVSLLEVNQAISAAVLDPGQIPIMNDFQLRLTTVEENLNAAEASILERAAITTVNGIDVRLQSAETEIDALNAEIILKAAVSDFTALDTRLSGAEVAIDALDVPSITQMVWDSRSQFDELDELSLNSLADLLEAYKSREALREDLAFARNEIAAVVSENREALVAIQEELVAAIGANLASINNEQIARATEDEALASRITTLATRIDGAETEISLEALSRATEDEALAGLITSLTTRMGDAESSIVTETLARSDADAAIVEDVTTLTTRMGDAETAIASEQLARSTADSALAADIASLTATVDGNTAAITAEQVARTNADSALAASVDTLTTNLNGVSASVTSQAAAISTIESFAAATYTLRLNAGGAEVGLEIVAADDPIAGPISALRINADNILLDGSVQAVHLDVGSVTAEKIDVENLSSISATIGLLRSAETGERIEMETDRIRVFDASNTLRVLIGRLT